MKLFEIYLKEVHAKQYTGTDDDMPDDFDNWLVNLDKDELINLGNKALEQEKTLAQKVEELNIFCDDKLSITKYVIGWDIHPYNDGIFSASTNEKEVTGKYYGTKGETFKELIDKSYDLMLKEKSA